MKFYKEGHRTMQSVDKDQVEAVEAAGWSRTKPEPEAIEPSPEPTPDADKTEPATDADKTEPVGKGTAKTKIVKIKTSKKKQEEYKWP